MELRQDLRLLPAPAAPDGRPRWMLHDPVAGRYHRLGEAAVGHLRGMRRGIEPPEELVQFLARAKLLAAGLPPDVLAREEMAAKPSLGQLLVHKYLFFRIPLVRPARALAIITPYFAFVWTRLFWGGIAGAGLLGLVLAARQWEVFAATFVGFLSPEGLVGYAAALVLLKCCHELGHGIAATRHGVRVPVIGLAFLVMFPILYTDTTEAWEVRSRRARLQIDAAGMAVEIVIACAALLLWSFLPDGPARAVAFFLATTSWTLSLLVNLNPCMRFDGYYLISDAMGVANLQATGFGLARWRMREALFGLGEPKPHLGDAEGAGMERVLLGYAYATWVYRFFLFIGIAVLVHHLFPKAIGIILFVVEIGMFIALPVLREFKVWGASRGRILGSPRGRASLAVGGLIVLALFAPIDARVSAPALLQAGDERVLYPPVEARVVEVMAAHGDFVDAGDVLVRLASPALAHEIRVAELRLASERAELGRAEAAQGDLAPTRRETLRRAETQLRGLRDLEKRLEVRAPIAGRIEAFRAGGALHAGRDVGAGDALLRVRSNGVELRARLSERDAARVRKGADARFIAPGMAVRARLGDVAPVAETALGEPALADRHGGAIRVDEDATGRLVPRAPRLAATLQLAEAGSETGLEVGEDRRGRVWIEAERESVAARVWRRVLGVLVRETDF